MNKLRILYKSRTLIASSFLPLNRGVLVIFHAVFVSRVQSIILSSSRHLRRIYYLGPCGSWWDDFHKYLILLGLEFLCPLSLILFILAVFIIRGRPCHIHYKMHYKMCNCTSKKMNKEFVAVELHSGPLTIESLFSTRSLTLQSQSPPPSVS